METVATNIRRLSGRARDNHMTEDEVSMLWEEFTSSQSAESKHKLMIQYIGLIRYVLNNLSLAPNAVLVEEDYLQFGIIGLNEALERYDMARGIKFETYAIPRIRGIIIDEVRRVDWLSRTARKRSQEFLQAADQLRTEEGREVTSEEVRRKLNLTPDEYKVYLRAAADATSSFSLRDSSNSDDSDESTSRIEAIPDDTTDNALDRITEKERTAYIARYLENLPERQRLVMSLYYYESLTFKEIGQLMKITESRVCQIHTAIVNDLRKKIREY